MLTSLPETAFQPQPNGLSLHKVRCALAVLKSFIGSVKVTVNEVEFGLLHHIRSVAQPTAVIWRRISNLFMALQKLLFNKDTLIAILIDEIQYFSQSELSALIIAMHKMQQRQLPLVLIAAACLYCSFMEIKSTPWHLFSFPVLAHFRCCLRVLLRSGFGDAGSYESKKPLFRKF